MANCRICGCELGKNFRGNDLPCAFCGAFAKDSELKRKRPAFKQLFQPVRETVKMDTKERKKKYYQKNKQQYKERAKKQSEEDKKRNSERVKERYRTDPVYRQLVIDRAKERYYEKRST